MAVSVRISIDDKDLREGLHTMFRQLSPEVVVDDVELVAEELIRRAIDSPIPSDRRFLANSDVVVKRKDHVTFGFNRIYAAFQDAPGRSTPYTIRPRTKKILYVPISPRGSRLHRRGNNPRDEGLVRGEDYVLMPRVVIPIKSYGSAVGPNHYFSETLKRNQEFVINTIADLGSRRLSKRFKPSRKKPGGGKRGRP